ncbi:MAG TPA: MFS transporter [Blastocatellia bacterium]|jgi:MFS family permease|nr:MFS transporter [Blastocatellia bacterium]HAF22404.1 MFS transporter [Blastocatellia bacterium]
MGPIGERVVSKVSRSFLIGHHSFGSISLANSGGKRLETTPAGYLELLRGNRGFRQLWLGQVVSQMGDWFDTIALYTIILNLTGSGRAIGLLLVARFVPSFIFGSLSGVVADRFSRRSIMIISDLLRAVVVLGFLLVRRADQLWIIYFLTVLQLAFSTFFEPAKTAAIPSIVSDRELVSANAISSVTWSVMLTLGAAIGGVVTGWFGTDVAFILDALTYLLSAALIATVRFPKRAPREKSKLTINRALGITETIEGARYVKRRPRVLALLLVKPAWGLGGGILTLLAVFGEKIFPVGNSAATGIGVLFAARGIGTAVGPIVARRISGEGKKRMQASIGIAFLIAAAFYMAFGGATSFVLALIVLGLAHTGGSILWVFSTVLLQRGVEDGFRGRVFAAELALLTLTMALSNYMTGELLDRFGLSPRVVAIGIGAFFLIPGIAWFATQRWWDTDKNEPAEKVVHLSRAEEPESAQVSG